ncbi:MAG: fibronectin type III domain-containing protein [Actinomycetota bacterium]|nr:fibronectin type III domain-containing protein [Actinomycetota bacterium]
MAVAALVGVVAVLTVTGVREPASALKLISGQAWLSDRATGSVTQVHGYGGHAGAQTSVGLANDPFTVVQRADGAYVLDTRTGRLMRVSNDGLGIAASQQEPGRPAGLQVVTSGNVTWVIDESSGVVQQVDPLTLTPRGRQIALGGSAGVATADGTGRLWVPLVGRGLVAEVIPDGSPARTFPVGQPGDTLSLASTAAGIWAVDPQAGKVVPLSDPTLATAVIPQSRAGGPAPVTASRSANPDIVVVEGSQVVDVNTATAMVSSVSGPGYSTVTQAVVNGSRTYLLDAAGHQLDVLNLDPLTAVGPVAVPAGSDQLIAHDHLVFVNDDQSPAAVVVAPNGSVTDISKYQETPSAGLGPGAPASVASTSSGPFRTGPASPPGFPSGRSSPAAPALPSAYAPPTPAVPVPTPLPPPAPAVQAPTPPSTPSLTSVTGGAGTLTIRWNPGSGVATGYNLLITPGQGGVAVHQTAAATATQAAVGGLTQGAPYCVQIQATGANGGSPLSTIQAATDCATTTPSAPGAPARLVFEPGNDSAWVTFGAAQGSSIGGLTYTVALNGVAVQAHAVPGQTYPVKLPIGSASGYDTGAITVTAANGGGSGPAAAANVWGYAPFPTADCIDATQGFFENGTLGPLGGCANNSYSVRVNPYDNIYSNAPPPVPMSASVGDELVCVYALTGHPQTADRYLAAAPGSTQCAPAPANYDPGQGHEVVWAHAGSTHTTLVQVIEGTMQNTGQVEDVMVGPGQTANQVAATTLSGQHVVGTWYDDPAS